MYIRKKRHRSGRTGVIVVEKYRGVMKELHTVGVSSDPDEIDQLVIKGREWIAARDAELHPRLDLFGEEREACEEELMTAERVLSCVSNILLNGSDLILDRVFDRIGFNRIEDAVFRKLVKARLSYPASKAATVEYLKNHFDVLRR